MTNIVIIPNYTEENPDIPNGVAVWNGFAGDGETPIDTPFVPVTRVFPPDGGDCNGMRGAAVGEVVEITQKDEYGRFSVLVIDGFQVSRVTYSGSRETLVMSYEGVYNQSMQTVAFDAQVTGYNIMTRALFGNLPVSPKQFERHMMQSATNYDWFAEYEGELFLIEHVEQSEEWLDCCQYYGIKTPDMQAQGVNRVFGFHTLKTFTYAVFDFQEMNFSGLIPPITFGVGTLGLGLFGGGYGGLLPGIMPNFRSNMLINIRTNGDED